MSGAASDETCSSSSASIQSFPLALHPNTSLWVSLHHHVHDPRNLFGKLRDPSSRCRLAMMDAARVVSLGHLVAAANMALCRAKSDQLAWDAVFCATGSTRFAHSLSEYCFGGEDSTTTEVVGSEGATIVVLAVSETMTVEEYKTELRNVGLSDSQSLDSFFAKQQAELSEQKLDSFCKWYKLTREEVEMSSLEQAVITRIATKFYV